MISSGIHEYMKVRQYIVDMSHHSDTEHALPSERKISELYRVSRSTVRRALSDLVKAHYLIKCPKRGYFVNRKRIDLFNGKIIGLIMHDSMNAFISASELETLASLYTEAAKYPVAIQNIICPNPEQLAADIQNSTLDGILWYGIPDHLRSCCELLRQTGIPVCALFQGNSEPDTDCDYIYLDHRRESHLQTRYLLERGAKTILYPDLPETDSFVQGYFQALAEYGIKPERRCIFSEATFAQDLPSLYRELHFDGVLCRFSQVNDVLQFAKNEHLSVPDNLQIITGTSPFSGSATRTLKPFQKIFRLMFRQLWNRMNGKPQKSLKLNSLEWSVIPGNTTREIF